MSLKYYDTFIILYADDTVICLFDVSSHRIIQKANTELIEINKYCEAHSLLLNVSKCKAMVVNGDESDFINQIQLNGAPLEIVSEYRYLGYVIDSKFKFSSQISKIIKSLSSCNYSLSRAKNFVPKHSMITLYYAIGISHIIYNKFIFIHLSDNKRKKISNKMIHSGAIINNCLLKYVNETDFNLNFILNYYCFLFLYKVFHTGFSFQLFDFLKVNNHKYNTRKKPLYVIERYNKNICRFGFNFFGPKMWHSLPSNLQSEESLLKFKKLLREHLNCFS